MDDKIISSYTNFHEVPHLYDRFFYFRWTKVKKKFFKEAATFIKGSSTQKES